MAVSESEVVARVHAIKSRFTELVGSDSQKVALIAVTKTFPASAMAAAFAAGCDGVGENYAQELIAKLPEVPLASRLPVHFIGHVQTNKVRGLYELVDVWQTVDRSSLVKELARECARRQAISDNLGPPEIYIQVNATGEQQKSGCAPTDVSRLVAEACNAGLYVGGLMTVGPSSGEPVATRQAFRLVAQLKTDLGLAECSMGMSGDYDIAIEEGSTAVRIGTALFGDRPRSE
jgi:pyridoxal phosphate enzyme (YggS family)